MIINKLIFFIKLNKFNSNKNKNIQKILLVKNIE